MGPTDVGDLQARCTEKVTDLDSVPERLQQLLEANIKMRVS
jgi:hypothetical protein